MPGRPRIGICAQYDAVCGGAARSSIRPTYVAAVRRAGGIPVILPVAEPGPAEPDVDIEARVALSAVDGLLLPGGSDFDTERLGLGPTHPAAEPADPRLQDWTIALARAALRDDVCVLGVCYGMQVLGLLGGGTLQQHLPDEPTSVAHQAAGGSAVRHRVSPLPDTDLAAGIGIRPVDVVSNHHQALVAVGSRWVVSARADDGLAEAIERPDRRFAVGVQWHPEQAPEGAPDAGLFRLLVRRAELAAAGAPVDAR